jgi:pyruvate formate lyase activating enzyme
VLTRAAYRKTSLVDFPGRVAAVIFLPLCNFRCPYCHNAGLVDPERADGELAPLGEFLAFLDRRKRVLGGVVISGGEPLLHEEAPRLAAAIHERGLAVKLDTNGSLPGRLEKLLGSSGPRLVDYVSLDLKTSPAAYARVAPDVPEAADRVLESIRILRAARRGGGVDFEIRITCAPGIVGLDDARAIADALEPDDDVVLQEFRPGGCLDPAWDSAEPYPSDVMETLLAAVQVAAPRTRIRGA